MTPWDYIISVMHGSPVLCTVGILHLGQLYPIQISHSCLSWIIQNTLPSALPLSSPFNVSLSCPFLYIHHLPVSCVYPPHASNPRFEVWGNGVGCPKHRNTQHNFRIGTGLGPGNFYWTTKNNMLALTIFGHPSFHTRRVVENGNNHGVLQTMCEVQAER